MVLPVMEAAMAEEALAVAAQDATKVPDEAARLLMRLKEIARGEGG